MDEAWFQNKFANLQIEDLKDIHTKLQTLNSVELANFVNFATHVPLCKIFGFVGTTTT